MDQLRNQINQIRKKFSKNEYSNKKLSTAESCNSGASQIILKDTTNTIAKSLSIN